MKWGKYSSKSKAGSRREGVGDWESKRLGSKGMQMGATKNCLQRKPNMKCDMLGNIQVGDGEGMRGRFCKNC